MRTRLTILLLFLYIPTSNAESTAEAMAAIIDANAQKYMDSIQLEAGGAAALLNGGVSPEIHLGLNYHYLKRFNLGIAADIPMKNDGDVPNINFGILAGIKSFNSVLGQHYYNVSVGSSIFENGKGIYVEPQINFILHETAPIKFFWVMHSVGISSTLALRYVFMQSNADLLNDSNTLLLRLNFYIKQRQRRSK